jgi:hypothetical protein
MTNNKNNQIPKITPQIEEDDISIQVYLPFSITWKDKEYYGNFIATISKNIGVEEYEIEWLDDEAPNFEKFENQIYKELEEILLEEVLARCNI